MFKPIIALDIDEVLASSAEQFIAFSNKEWGTTLGVHEYQEHWSDMWQVDHDETERRAVVWRASNLISQTPHMPEAVAVLQSLTERFELYVTTSRPTIMQERTQLWLETNYPGLFSQIHFAGIFDDVVTEHALTASKADLYNTIGAQYVIDDQLKHCLAAAQDGLHAVLFGDYPWNQIAQLPPGVIRAADWDAIKAHFAAV